MTKSRLLLSFNLSLSGLGFSFHVDEHLDWRELMNITAVTLAALGLVSAATAAAAAPVSDVDYLRASRCRGIAAGIGADSTAIDAYLKGAGQSRSTIIIDRGKEEFAKAKREGRGEGKARLSAELSGACAAYVAKPQAVATR
jgi:hypothetical protein